MMLPNVLPPVARILMGRGFSEGNVSRAEEAAEVQRDGRAPLPSPSEAPAGGEEQ